MDKNKKSPGPKGLIVLRVVGIILLIAAIVLIILGIIAKKQYDVAYDKWYDAWWNDHTASLNDKPDSSFVDYFVGAVFCIFGGVATLINGFGNKIMQHKAEMATYINTTITSQFNTALNHQSTYYLCEYCGQQQDCAGKCKNCGARITEQNKNLK